MVHGQPPVRGVLGAEEARGAIARDDLRGARGQGGLVLWAHRAGARARQPHVLPSQLN